MSCACMDGAELCIVTSLVLLCMGRGVGRVVYGWFCGTINMVGPVGAFFVMINGGCDVDDMSVFGAARSGRGLGGGA